jgi:nucleoid-associated protein YejK
MYAYKEDLKNALIKMVEAQSNEYSLYEYISHEVKFGKPIVVEGLGEELGKMSLV